MSTELDETTEFDETAEPVATAGPDAAMTEPAGVITIGQVAHLANLARIDLTAEEIAVLTPELQQIVESVAKVTEVATPDVPASSHPLPLSNAFRDDVPVASLTVEQALSGAPDRDGDKFRVPAILDEE